MRLGAKFGLMVGIATVMTAGILGVLTYRQVSTLLEHDVVEVQLTTSHGVLAKIDDALSYARRDMRILAGSEFLKVYVASPAYRTAQNTQLLQNELRERAEYTGPWHGLTVFDRKGTFLLTTDPYTAIRSLNNPMIADAFRVALSGRFYNSGLIEAQPGGERTLIFAMPIREREGEPPGGERDEGGEARGEQDEGLVIGVILAQYRWSTIASLVERAAPPDGGIYLLDAAGHAIAAKGGVMSDAHSADFERHDIMQQIAGVGRNEVVRTQDADGRAMLSTHMVLADGRFPSLGWGLVIEQPETAIFAPARRLAWRTVMIVTGVLAILALTLAMFGYRLTRPLARLARMAEHIGRGDFRERLHYGGRDEVGKLAASFNAMAVHLQAHEAQLLSAKNRIQSIVDTVPGILYSASSQGLRLTYVSPAAEPLLGFIAEDFAADPGLRGKLILDEDRERIIGEIGDAKKAGKDFVVNYRALHRDGQTVVWIEDRGSWERDGTGQIVALHGLMTDITERKQHEAQLARATRALNLLHSHDRLLARATSESEWVHGICEGLVEGDRYACAWIGLIDPERPDEPVRVAAYLGADSTFVALAASSSEPAQDRLPHNHAMRERRVCVVDDLLEMGGTEAWAQRVLERGFASLAALPLIGENGVLGAITLYSEKPGKFDEQELVLLDELSANLAYGLEVLRSRSRNLKSVEA
ncbi:hypothetical protein BI364_15350 [Acidihalobacter yilgarnensis]|uniref:PAS domain S-box protein n=1 Tax=Acidihalobacter yilgarnensis TaxID=2819280 RepID=A0A1D8IRJ9_9GAMM|nr:HAMP domain-containing protein [Acidihalobacter yilgarnensis]AOU99130.1 hypothetical protein BI364_15350 [Acidihalobacter yilgarnensis]